MADFDSALLDSEEPFATGASTYSDTYPGVDELHPRIYVEFRPKGADSDPSFLALLDTGGHYCILSEEVASSVRNHLSDCLGQTVLRTAHGPVRGELYMLTIELLAEAGEHLDIDAVVFIAPGWRAPSFLGYSGMLDRLRFALNPQTNRFYFARAL